MGPALLPVSDRDVVFLTHPHPSSHCGLARSALQCSVAGSSENAGISEVGPEPRAIKGLEARGKVSVGVRGRLNPSTAGSGGAGGRLRH